MMRRSHRTDTQTDTPSHQHGAFTPKKPATSKNLRGRKSVEYGHHMSRGSYDPMNCTASCFVVGPHLMMVSETFPLHLFPLGLTTTEKDKGPTGAFTGPRDSSPGTPCVPQLGARRAYPHAPARSRGFPPARERCRPPGAARRSRDSYASRKPSSAVTVRTSLPSSRTHDTRPLYASSWRTVST